MNKPVIAVIDGTKARFFTLEAAEIPEYESGPNLVEQEGLANQANELHGKELWANTKTGRNRGSGSQGHGYDDHRQSHISEFERSFAKEIVTRIVDLTQTHQSRETILVAEPQILGYLREAVMLALPKNLKIQELAKDLCKLKPLEIHEYLADKKLLAERKVVTRR